MIKGLPEIESTLNTIKAGIVDTKINNARATRFVHYTKDHTKIGLLGLKHNSEATRIIQGKSHSPEYNRGDLIKQMKVRTNNDGSSEAGYFRSDTKKPQKGKLTYFHIAVIQHKGYRIPLQGAKGERVRKFLMVHGIFPRKTRSFLVARPRPFLHNSAQRYYDHNVDKKVAEKEFNKMWGSL